MRITTYSFSLDQDSLTSHFFSELLSIALLLHSQKYPDIDSKLYGYTVYNIRLSFYQEVISLNSNDQDGTVSSLRAGLCLFNSFSVWPRYTGWLLNFQATFFKYKADNLIEIVLWNLWISLMGNKTSLLLNC